MEDQEQVDRIEQCSQNDDAYGFAIESRHGMEAPGEFVLSAANASTQKALRTAEAEA